MIKKVFSVSYIPECLGALAARPNFRPLSDLCFEIEPGQLEFVADEAHPRGEVVVAEGEELRLVPHLDVHGALDEELGAGTAVVVVSSVSAALIHLAADSNLPGSWD